MSHRIAVVSQKGGVGKTTTCLNLGVALAEAEGQRCLIVDLDPQGAIGLALAQSDTEWPGIAEVLACQATAEDVLFATKHPHLGLLPRGRLDPVDVPEYEAALTGGGVLEAILSKLEGGFDYMLIDTPAGVGSVTRAALEVSQYALVPVQAEPLALRSIGQSLRVLDFIRDSVNPELTLLGLLPVMVDIKDEASQDVLSELWSGFSAVLETTIPRAAVFQEASRIGLPLSFLGGRRAPEARRFELLASEIRGRIASTGETDGETQPQRQLI